MLTQARLHQVLDYDPATGDFRWRVRRRLRIGTIAGSMTSAGYREIMIDGQRYLAHRLAWFYVHGHWPAGELDHKNRDRRSSKLIELREATSSQNHSNRGPQKNNACGVKGVHRKKDRWIAQIKARSKVLYLGTHDSIAAAQSAYATAAYYFYGPFARLT